MSLRPIRGLPPPAVSGLLWEDALDSRPIRSSTAFIESSSGAAPPLAGPMAASPRCSSEPRAFPEV